MKNALELIRDIAADYDGFRSIEGLKSLIDEIGNIANKALQEKTVKKQ